IIRTWISKMNLPTLFLLLCHVFLTDGATIRRWCYFTNWAQYRNNPAKFTPVNINPNLCTHISYAFATVKNCTVTNFEKNDVTVSWKPGMFEEVNNLKQQHPHLVTYLAIGGWNLKSAPFTEAVLTPASRKIFIDSAIKLARDYKFDGIEIDWEYPAARGSPPEDKIRFKILISELKQALINEQYYSRKPKLGLAVTVAAGYSKIIAAYDIPSLSADIDFINLMSYDFNGAWDKKTGHNSPLVRRGDETGEFIYWNLQDAAKYWVNNGAPLHKMNVGIPLYGRTFTLSNRNYHGVGAQVSDEGKAGIYSRTKGFLAYYEICHFLNTGATMEWDNIQKVPYAYKDDQWVSFENTNSIKIKAEWIKNYGFGGVMIWSLDLDDFAGMCGGEKNPLINTVIRVLNNSPVEPWQHTTPSTSFNTMCLGRSNGNYPYRNECKKYIMCYNGFVQVRSCQNFENFNPTSGNCVWESYYPCNIPTPTPPVKRGGVDTRNYCQVRADGVFESPNACNEYIYCMSRQTFIYHCPNGLYFDSRIGSCFFKEQVPCTDNVNVPLQNFCNGKIGGFYPHPTDCHKYIVCSRGLTSQMSCLNGQVFENNACRFSTRFC
ncbi:acidic mammalian chitinase-like isoform X1, partial [Argonauta hians]